MSKKLKNLLPHAEILIDDQLSLRQVRLDEANRFFDIINNDREYLAKWLPFPAFTNTAQDSADFIASTAQKRIDGSEYGFGIILNDELVGHTSLMHINDDQDPEIGYWIASGASGKGIVTQTTNALTNYGFNELGLKKIIIKADPKNTGSNRIAEKLGYRMDRTEHDDRIGLSNVWVLERF